MCVCVCVCLCVSVCKRVAMEAAVDTCRGKVNAGGFSLFRCSFTLFRSFSTIASLPLPVSLPPLCTRGNGCPAVGPDALWVLRG